MKALSLFFASLIVSGCMAQGLAESLADRFDVRCKTIYCKIHQDQEAGKWTAEDFKTYDLSVIGCHDMYHGTDEERSRAMDTMSVHQTVECGEMYVSGELEEKYNAIVEKVGYHEWWCQQNDMPSNCLEGE